MKCQSCGFENPEQSKFCGECGSRIKIVCSSCGQPIDATMKFCTNCGQPLKPQKKEVAAQQKKVEKKPEDKTEKPPPTGSKPKVEELKPEPVEKTAPVVPYLVKKDGTKTVLEKEKMVIGKGEDCDLVLTSPGVSTRHAGIENKGDNWTITDLGSTNGTYVNGSAISSQSLKDGDRVIIGADSFSFHDIPVTPGPVETNREPEQQFEISLPREEPPRERVDIQLPKKELSMTPDQVKKLAKKMEKGMPSPVFKSKSLAMVMFSDEKVRWAGTCWSYWNFGASRTRELLIGVTPFRVILYYEAAIGGDACQSYWYDVDFGGLTWKSGLKTWRGFTMAPPELVKKKINLYPQRIDINGKAKTLLMASPLETLKTPTPEKKLKKNPEAFFNVLHQAYENRKAVNPESLYILLNNPLEAPKIPGALVP